ncbi:MAG: TIM barrel protein [Planctomycetaceae bacterium]|nr:TIM barrel protein [Planctomycetaceae bacterium]
MKDQPTHASSRRQLLRASAAFALASSVSLDKTVGQEPVAKKGRIKQTVCKWCFPKSSLDQLAEAAKSMGLVGVDLLRPQEFPIVQKHGLVCTMTTSHSIGKGLNDVANHDSCLQAINTGIEANEKAGFRNVICFSGNRNGIDDKTGLRNCVKALKQITPVAEKAGVVINMELLNSRVNHPDYMCDKSDWGIELVKQVGSDNFRLLYDIYHMQIMEGDIIRSIQDNHMYFGHYHTAGNPGRHELDQHQELNYPAICNAIAASGFDGYLGQEFIPQRDPMKSLSEAVALCDV